MGGTRHSKRRPSQEGTRAATPRSAATRTLRQERPTEVHDVCSRPRTGGAASYLASQAPRARSRTEARAPTFDSLPPRRRPRRARAAGGAISAVRAGPRAALPLHGRAVRRPVPGGQPRVAKGHRPLDPDHGSKFPSFAAPTILGELKRHFRDKGWAVHVPRDLQERTLEVSRQTEALSKQLARSPKPREVARALQCSVEDVLEAQQAADSYDATSLDAPVARDDDEAGSLIDLMGSDDSPTSSSKTATPSRAPGRTCRTPNARCSSCASSTTSPSARSANGSATPRCTSREYCAAP